MNFRRIALLATVCAFLLAVPAWAGVDVAVVHTFDQTGNAYGSQNDPISFGLFAQMYDNFTLSCSGGCGGPDNTVTWTGEYFNPPNQGPILNQHIVFYADNGGQPGAQVFAFTDVGGNGSETFLGTFGGFPTYTYSEKVSFGWASPGVQYWMSIYPDLDFPPQWGWSSASNAFGPCDGCDGVSYQDFFGARSQIGADMTFSILPNNVGVPEPGTLIMLGTGVLGLAGVIRRKLS